MVDETRLILLMGDGPVSIVSEGTLSPEQYADLHAIVKDTFAVGDLMMKVEGLSVAWGVKVTVERAKKAKEENED